MIDPPPGLMLRPGDARDLGEVMGTMALAFDAAYGEAWTKTQCLSVLSLPGVWLTLARQEARPAGFALTRIVLDEAELLLLAVRPAQRRAGVGHALLVAAAGGARARGAARMHLEVRDGNGALALYEAAGFASSGRRRGYYRGSDGSTFDAITLSIALSNEVC